MYYIVYKITNLINGKYYVGQHKTDNLDDGYMGSGKLIKNAIKKYGIEKFKKEILFTFDNENEMLKKEAELVVIDENSYNLCEGGKGGWSYINRLGIPKFKDKRHSEETKEELVKAGKARKHSEETKKKISEANKATNASRGKKTSIALKGKSKSEEHKRKIAEAIKQKHLQKSAGLV